MTASAPANVKPRAGEHTREAWRVGQPRDNSGVRFIEEGGHATVGKIYDEEDARRIVACVNYCEGVPTELLERHPGDVKTISELAIRNAEEADQFRAREKVLVAAIEAALAYCESEAIGTVQQEIADNERMRQTLRDALEYGR